MADEEKHEESVEKHDDNAKKRNKDDIEINLNVLKKFGASIKKYWIIPALLLIMIAGFYVRVASFNYPYLLNVDSYYFYRYTNFIVQTGSVPNPDPYMLAPQGFDTSHLPLFYPYLSAYSYFAARTLVPSLELWQFFIYFPALLAALAAIPTYFIGKALLDRKAGVIAALFMVFNPFNMTRTLGGDPDSDAIVILMTLAAIACFLIAYKHVESKGLDRSGILYSIIAGLALAAFSNTWGGSWYVVWLFLGFIAAKFALEFFTKGKISMAELKPALLSYLIIFVVYFALTMPFLGWDHPLMIAQQPFGSFGLKTEAHTKFPNVMVSVAEMMAPDSGLTTVIQRVGAELFILSILSAMYLVSSFIFKRRHLDTFVFMAIWFLGPLYASIVAIRFIVLLSAPVTIMSAIVLAKFWRLGLDEDKSFFD